MDGVLRSIKRRIFIPREGQELSVATQDNRLESVDDIDLERVVIDREYRRRVIAFLNRVDVRPGDPERVESTDPSPST